MARETLDERAAQEATRARGGGEGADDAHAQRVGPVAIERLRKDDGRALILYSHDSGDRQQ
jgi:hypothetical protein